MRLSDHRYGRLAETAAAWWLRLRGYRIVGRNLRVAGREVDILARRGDVLVVVEVKARRSDAFGEPEQAIGPRTRRRLHEAGEMLAARDPTVRELRFDLVAVRGLSLRHLPAAF